MTAPLWLPNFFILGMPKAGTSSLNAWLAAHPDAVGALSKEACFFMDRDSHAFRPDFHIGMGLERYRAEFAHRNAEDASVVIDSTPTYIYQRAALEHVPDLASAPRCLVVVREPAEQILSLYRYFRDNWNDVPTTMSFAEFVAASRDGTHEFSGNELAQRAISNARHAEILRPWRLRLDRDRLMVRSFDELRADPRAFTISVARWIGLAPEFYDTFDFPRENQTLAPRFHVLQRVNIALRSHLPKGSAYRLARRVYHRLNLQKEPVAPDEAAIMAALREEFAEANAELARDYGIDISRWGGADQRVSTES